MINEIEKMRSADDFPTFLLANKLLEAEHRDAIFLGFFQSVTRFCCISNYFPVRKNVKQESHLFYCTL